MYSMLTYRKYFNQTVMQYQSHAKCEIHRIPSHLFTNKYKRKLLLFCRIYSNFKYFLINRICILRGSPTDYSFNIFFRSNRKISQFLVEICFPATKSIFHVSTVFPETSASTSFVRLKLIWKNIESKKNRSMCLRLLTN